ncbi:MAG: acetate--CoA ligase family protein [Burkholderiaceae bacterium]
MTLVTASLDTLFKPRSIAVVGASNDLQKIGGIPLGYLRQYQYAGDIYPVNPNYDTVQSLPAYPSLEAIGRTVDMAIFAVPARQIPAAIADAAKAGLRSAVMFSSGFAEVGGDGVAAQAALVAQAKAAGIRLLGPNCLGFMAIRDNLFATFTPALQRVAPVPGNLAIVSQSGAFGSYALQLARRRGLGLSYWATTGNEGDIQMADCLAWLAGDEGTRVILCYLEGCRDGQRLRDAFALARANGKRVVMIKVGSTEAGGAAAASHTAALSGEDAVYDALFRQYGVWRAHSIEEFFAVGYAAAVADVPAAGRLGILTVSGGVGALMADDASNAGLPLPAMPEAAQKALRDMVPFCAPGNPVDITGQFQNDHRVFDQAVDLMAQSGLYDALAIFTAASGLSPVYGPRVQRSVLRAREQYPALATALITMTQEEDRAALDAAACLCFEDPSTAIRAISALRFFAQTAAQAVSGSASRRPMDVAAVDRSLNEPLNEVSALRVIDAAGIRTVTSHEVTNVDEAVERAGEIGYPVVLKVVSAEIAHKSDVGGVRLNLTDETALRAAWEAMHGDLARLAPNAALQGALVAPMMADGIEMIIGTMQDPVFGPVVLVGLGGVTAEALRDTALRVAPVDLAQARSMIEQLRGYRLLQGMRGAPPADVDALADAIVALSNLALARQDRIESIDINPLRVLADGKGVLALDALIVPRG